LQNLKQTAFETFGGVSVLMNNAGISLKTTAWSEAENWRKLLEVNLWGVINSLQAFTAEMIAQGMPSLIINTGSKQGITNPPGNPAYNVAKAGVKALTEALALEVADDGILVNAIAPGPILAPPETSEQEHEAVVRNTPLGRWGGPEAIVAAVLALIESDFITGETIRVDGGRHLY
jgi:NAD(P)-dependent dehydrogenase (short-subunit alcohol dehydrogenase family)